VNNVTAEILAYCLSEPDCAVEYRVTWGAFGTVDAFDDYPTHRSKNALSANEYPIVVLE
jgi:hypothetical protein